MPLRSLHPSFNLQGFTNDDAAHNYFELLPYSRSATGYLGLMSGSNIGETGTW